MSVVDRANRLVFGVGVAAMPPLLLVETAAASTAIALLPALGLGGWLLYRQRGDVGLAGDPPSAAATDPSEPAISISPTDLSAAIEAVVASPSGAELNSKTLEMSTTPTQVEADPMRLHQVIDTLLAIAIRHGGDSITVRSFSSDGFGRLEVSDNGPGIDDEEAEAIFAPCGHARITDRHTGSISLDLMASRQLARLMGGDLVAFRQGDLTTFRLCLPLADLSRQKPASGD